jgi:unsaturated rhamnogalacturonyl hydrolase
LSPAFGLIYTVSMNAPTTAIEPFWPAEKAPDVIAWKVIAELLSRKQFMLYDTGDVRALHYAEACAVFGAARLAGLLKDKATIEKLADRYRVENLPENTANHVDANVCGIIELELYLQTGNRDMLARGLELADGQWRHPRPDGLTAQTRFWIDDVWMIGILQTEAWRATKKAVYLERAAREIDACLANLQQPSGLFFHGPQAPHYWGRGNGWVAAGLAEILSELTETNPHYASLLSGYKKMMASLRQYQTPSGMWRQLIDHEEAWEESSCTAMFGSAVTIGVKKGLLPAKTYTPVVEKAWLALADYIDADGRVREVCAGTGQKDDAAFYLKRPRVIGDLHGQAPLLWFAFALLADY